MLLRFQHTKVLVTDETLKYTQTYKGELLKRIVNILNFLDIKYYLSNGNLIEYLRGNLIIHDDDIDIRYDIRDFSKWKNYCLKLENRNNKYYDVKHNLIFDNRAIKFEKQRENGIQIKLDIENITNISLRNKSILKNCPNNLLEKGIHADLVPCCSNGIWQESCYVFLQKKALRNVTIFGIKNVSIPNKKICHYILKKQYGREYLIPNINYKRVNKDTYLNTTEHFINYVGKTNYDYIFIFLFILTIIFILKFIKNI